MPGAASQLADCERSEPAQSAAELVGGARPGAPTACSGAALRAGARCSGCRLAAPPRCLDLAAESVDEPGRAPDPGQILRDVGY